jgi:hypothetical protein
MALIAILFIAAVAVGLGLRAWDWIRTRLWDRNPPA